ncbi:MAG: hypothetical protein QM657_15480 [Lacrimispora sp.]|uniref:hypothetical protein n=1 Tax=Lacrimispora sp. TaxID=2719234 RepID=UPI0039E5EF1E
MHEAKSISEEVKKAFTELDESAIKNSPNIEEVLSKLGTGQVSAINFANGIKDGSIQLKEGQTVLQGYQAYLTMVDIKTKALTVSMKVLSTVGWMAVFAAASWAIGKAIEAFDDYVHRLDNAKEALASTESELSSLKTEIDTTSDRIKELQSLDTLSITEAEDLERLKEQNKELKIRQQYLEKQKQEESKKVADLTKEKFNSKYSASVDRENIDKYKEVYDRPKQTGTDVGSYPPDSDPYAGDNILKESKSLANLVAQYEYYQQEKAKAINNEDAEGIERFNAKLQETESKLRENRTELQGYSDDLTATGESSAELDGVTERIKMIDNLLLSPGQQLVDFINSTTISKDIEKLKSLANTGKLTQEELERNFSDVNDYLKQNGLIPEDLISVIGIYGEKLVTANAEVENSFAKPELISKISSLSGGFETLDKIMGSIHDKENPFDLTLLSDKDFTKTFSGIGASYSDFIDVMSSSPKDIDAVQSSFDNLVSEWIESTGLLNGLTDESKNLAVSFLEGQGIANAEEIVTARLAQTQAELAAQKHYTANASGVLNNATISEVNAFVLNGIAAGESEQALSRLALQKLAINNVKIDTASDIDQVIALANAAGASSTVLAKLANAKAIMARAEAGGLNGSAGDFRLLESASAVLSEISNGTFNYEFTKLNADDYKKTAPDDGGSKTQEEAKQEFDWIARKTKAVQESYAKLEELASKDTIAYLGLTQEEFDNAKSIFDNGLGNTVEGLAQLQSYANEAGLSLGELYTMIQSGAPGASKENALQRMLKMQTETLLPQYQREVEAYSKSYEDALKAIPSEYKDKIESGGADVESLPADLAKKVQTAIDANEKLKSSEKQLADGEKEHIETIKKLHQNRIDATDIENEKLEQSNKIIKSQMELMEARGEIVDADFYKRQIENNKGLISGNQQNIDEWESEMADLRAVNIFTDSKDYKELQAKVKAARNEIQRLKLEQEECNQTLKQMPIDNLSTIISMYDDITAKIENWGTVYTATGQKLDGEYYQALISNGITVIEQYGKQAKLVKNLMGEYKKGSTKWQELYKQLQDIDSATSSMLSNLKKYNEELLKMPLDSINSYSDSLQKVADGLSNVQSEQDLVIGTVTNAIQKQIDTINDQKDAYQEANESQKKGLQDKLDLLQKQNDQLKRQMAYEQSLYNLQKINQQATELVIRNGQESYEVDADKLREAQEQVANAKFDLETGAIQDQIDSLDEALEKQNELYDSQIEKLEIISNRWSEISEKVKTAQDEAKTSSILGNKWKDQVLSGNDTALFNTFSKMYQNTAEQLKKYQDQIDSTNSIQSLLEDYVASYKAGEITYSEAVRGINTLLSQLNQNMSATGNLQNIFDYLGIVNDRSANADSILKGIQTGLKDTATELLKSMEQYNKNAGIISEQTSSWQKLTSNVEKMLDVLREVRDNLRDSYSRDDDDDNDNTRYGGGRDGSPGTPGKGDYVDSGPGIKLGTSLKDGITRGLVGSYSDFDREASMKLLGLKKLDPDEIPAVLHMGEAVFNKEQQQKLLDNFASAYSFAPNIPDYSNLLNNVGIANTTTTPVITFNGGINIQECNNSDDLASEILNGGLTMAINQGLGRR